MLIGFVVFPSLEKPQKYKQILRFAPSPVKLNSFRGLNTVFYLFRKEILGCPGLEPGTYRLKAEYSTIELATLLLRKNLYFFKKQKKVGFTS